MRALLLALLLLPAAALAWQPPHLSDSGLPPDEVVHEVTHEVAHEEPAPEPVSEPAPVVTPVLVTTPTAEPSPQPALRILPGMPMRGTRAAILFLILGSLFMAVDLSVGIAARRLAPRGLLPTAAEAARVLARLLVGVLALAFVAAVLPRFLAPALPLFLVAVAVALGWSARDLLPDLVAGLVLLAERRVRPGYRLTAGEQVGVVEAVGLRATWLRDDSGRRVAVPNRALVASSVAADDHRWPSVEAVVLAPPTATTERTRQVLREACLLSPWLAPEGEVVVLPAGEHSRWRVRARLLEARYAERFTAALQEELEEAHQAGLLGDVQPMD